MHPEKSAPSTFKNNLRPLLAATLVGLPALFPSISVAANEPTVETPAVVIVRVAKACEQHQRERQRRNDGAHEN